MLQTNKDLPTSSGVPTQSSDNMLRDFELLLIRIFNAVEAVICSSTLSVTSYVHTWIQLEASHGCSFGTWTKLGTSCGCSTRDAKSSSSRTAPSHDLKPSMPLFSWTWILTLPSPTVLTLPSPTVLTLPSPTVLTLPSPTVLILPSPTCILNWENYFEC